LRAPNQFQIYDVYFVKSSKYLRWNTLSIKIFDSTNNYLLSKIKLVCKLVENECTKNKFYFLFQWIGALAFDAY
jgi:hypothetical protein